MTTAIEEKQANFVTRLYRGDVPLAHTFWLFFFFPKIICSFIDKWIASNFATVSTQIWYVNAASVFYTLYVVYFVFILIALWRSAGKYDGGFIKWVVRIIVILNAITILSVANTLVKITIDPMYDMDTQVSLMNKSLPIMIDKETRMDMVSVKEKDLYYKLTVVNYKIADLDVSEFTTFVSKHTRISICQDARIMEILYKDWGIVYVYHDKNNVPILAVTVTKADCSQVM